MRLARDVAVRQDFQVDMREFSIEKHPEQTPILINNFNRLGYLQRLLDALDSRGYENVYVIDNNSTYEPLLEYYKDAGLRVFYLNANVGHLALWTTPVGANFVDRHYVYTDPDLAPVTECPNDFLAYFRDVLVRYPKIEKVGFGLKTDDLPKEYALRDEVIEHERQFQTVPVAPGLFRASIDTTFALYRPGAAGGSWLPSLRTGAPYVARHLPWYADSAHPDDEETFYRSLAMTSTHWSLLDRDPESGVHMIMMLGEPIKVLAGRNDDVWTLVTRGEQEPEAFDVIDRFLDADHSYVEIGGGVGATVLYGSRVARHVYVFEQDANKYSELAENVDLNRGRRDNITASDVPVDGPSFEELLSVHHVDDCGLIRIDVGGEEYRLLPTMLPYLRRFRPTLFVALHLGKPRRMKTENIVNRVVRAAVNLATTLNVARQLHFYKHIYDAYGNELTFRRLIRISRGRLSIVATDRRWDETSC